MTIGLKAACGIDAMVTSGRLLERTHKAGLERSKAMLSGIDVPAGRQFEVVFQNASEVRTALSAEGCVPVTLEQLRHGFTVKLTGFASGRR